MTFEDAMRAAAQAANRGVQRAMRKYAAGYVTDEDDLTGILIGNLDAEIEGEIGGLTWSSSAVRHRRGSAAEEKRIGADIVIHVALETPTERYSKGALIQAKRLEPQKSLTTKAKAELNDQCDRMLAITPASFVFDYAMSGMRCAPATRIRGATGLELYDQCSWTSYRFFLELFRCPVGDPRLTSAFVDDLPVPYLIEIKGEGEFTDSYA